MLPARLASATSQQKPRTNQPRTDQPGTELRVRRVKQPGPQVRAAKPHRWPDEALLRSARRVVALPAGSAARAGMSAVCVHLRRLPSTEEIGRLRSWLALVVSAYAPIFRNCCQASETIPWMMSSAHAASRIAPAPWPWSKMATAGSPAGGITAARDNRPVLGRMPANGPCPKLTAAALLPPARGPERARHGQPWPRASGIRQPCNQPSCGAGCSRSS